VNENRIRKQVLNMKLKVKCPKERPRSRWKQVRNEVTQREGSMERFCG
jgi:hypothetical protein